MRRFIVDGNNVLHAHPKYRGLLAHDFDAARARFVSDLAGFADERTAVVVVFDGQGEPGSDGAPHRLGHLTVVFSQAGTDADTVIEGLAAASRARGEMAVVVTSDTETRNAVASGTVTVRSAEMFVDDVTVETADRLDHGSSGSERVSLAGRLDPDIAKALALWARGQMP